MLPIFEEYFEGIENAWEKTVTSKEVDSCANIYGRCFKFLKGQIKNNLLFLPYG